MACDRFHLCRAHELALAVGAAVLSLVPPLLGQFGPLLNPLQGPQAKSQEELDAFLEIVTVSDSRVTIQKVDRFVSHFAQSEFLGVAFQYKMLACYRTGDFECLLRSGDEVLQLQPDNLNVLLTLASAIPDAVAGRRDATELLERAEDFAQRGLQRLGTIHIPHEIPLERWKILKGEMEAHAHQALGQVAAKRGNLRRAIAEFEMAAFNNPSPQGTQFLLLGSAHQMAGNIDAARKALLRAVELGPDEIRTLASNELRKLNEGNLDDRPDRKAP